MSVLVYCLTVFALILKAGADECKDLSDHHNYHLLQDMEPICGRSSVDSAMSNRIVWGNTTALGAYPWMAIVAVTEDVYDGYTSRSECTGTLITDQYVLTAASCFDFIGDKARLEVWLRVYQEHRLGIINCDLQQCSLPPLKVDAQSYVSHQEANIALVRLKEKVQFDDFMRPICLPLTCDFRSFDFVGTIATMLGFDNIGVERTGLEASALEKAQMIVVTRQKCQEQYGTEREIQLTHMCAYWPGGRAACKKDIGGPLLTETHRDGLQMYQIGVIAVSLCEDNYTKIGLPTVFVRLGDYIPFILSSIY